uniref:Uncharacterized protein n=1 Tax=Anguilla anguilla TaxID=7936 RepID=A0A0E9TZQ6_ANGAN
MEVHTTAVILDSRFTGLVQEVNSLVKSDDVVHDWNKHCGLQDLELSSP